MLSGIHQGLRDQGKHLRAGVQETGGPGDSECGSVPLSLLGKDDHDLAHCSHSQPPWPSGAPQKCLLYTHKTGSSWWGEPASRGLSLPPQILTIGWHTTGSEHILVD